ncbi:MAG: hypothetical protein KDC35_00850 [Acidobacteria bacterium]|nr:hypothetical protein [Acidobacteriota bacterium]
MSDTDYVAKLHISSLRALLAMYFVLLGGMVLWSIPPLPEEPPRINYLGLLLVVGCVLSVIHLFISKNRWVPLLMALCLPLAAKFLAQRIKLMLMLLEDPSIEKVYLYSLPLVFICLVSPPILREFDVNGITPRKRAGKGVVF